MEAKERKGKVDRILQKYQHDKSALVDILHDVMTENGYLQREWLEEVSHSLGVPLSRVYSVATFFKAFSLEPRGRHLIHVCLGTACHVRGADKVLEKIEQELGIKRGENTPDLRFTLETVNCVGACALGPMVIVGEDYHGEMTPDAVSSVLENYT
jgi:NADH-quinone oxidoreductase subunit E